MNNDASPSSAARQRAIQPDADDDEGHGVDEAGEPSAASRESERQAKRRSGLAKKLQFMSHLQKSLDTIVFAYLCVLYYMECSFPRFLLRILPHYIFISPKDSRLSLPAHRPHVFAIFVPNMLCVLFHMLFALPRASEATRGYLHGGVLIDFIGQKPPTWRLGLLLFDLIIWSTQCLMLAVHQEREKLRKAVNPSLQSVPGTENTTGAWQSTQDHDAEERGVLRDENDLMGDEGIELQPLRPDDGAEAPMGASYSQAAVDLVDVLWSGNALLANFHVIHAVRTVGNDVQSAAAYSLQSLGYTASLAAAIAAERRARLASRRPRPS
ncbi:DSC E3 ubiquitin ligase complex subunit 4 [Echria macrotheca]|uniref:DSC E3 ubiquitin ligase complex subunit 4 n=1 Tax=Echria macrotheca TaxID=438768 RepID=A0AAJ0BG69_9PEZI|nr:DSC E3 ubiquitin ligase complex subunit 4 [Echria macrotheca]